jgi:hypothetical protein
MEYSACAGDDGDSGGAMQERQVEKVKRASDGVVVHERRRRLVTTIHLAFSLDGLIW